MKKKIAIDTYYQEKENLAHTVGVIFEDPENDSTPQQIIESVSNITAEYIPGQFYKRELPPITYLLETVLGLDKLKTEFDTIIVDGFYQLWDHRPGLGKHLETYLREQDITGIEIIGVAKSKARDSDTFAQKCIRGKHGTTNPLWVNGSDPGKNYAKYVRKMAGEYRLPDILKVLDNYTKYKI